MTILRTRARKLGTCVCDRRLSPIVVTASLLALLFAWPASARAQATHQWVNPYSGSVYNNPMSSLVDTMIRGRMQLDATRRSLEESRDRAPPPTEGSGPAEEAVVVEEIPEIPVAQEAPPVRAEPDVPPRHFPLEASDFAPATRLHPTIDRFLVQASLKPPAKKKIRALILAQEKRLAAVRPSNVAIALASVIVTARVLVGGEVPSAERVDRIVHHANDDLAGSPVFQAMSNQGRQTYYEQLIVVLGFLNIYVQAGQNAPAMHAQGAAMATMILDGLGVSTRPSATHTR
jgi:hypothetical protein